MSSLLEKALERVRNWPQSRQDDLARMALDMDENGALPIALSDDERRVLRAAWLQSETGDFASEEEVLAAYKSFGQ